MAKKAKKGGDILVVSSKIKAYVKSKRMMSSGELTGALSREVEKILDKAMTRTKSNRRSTVKAQDL
ncbi:hypothetical protein ACFL56_01995 [Candidatus Margulisiibacteriota bacterium]